MSSTVQIALLICAAFTVAALDVYARRQDRAREAIRTRELAEAERRRERLACAHELVELSRALERRGHPHEAEVIHDGAKLLRREIAVRPELDARINAAGGSA